MSGTATSSTAMSSRAISGGDAPRTPSWMQRQRARLIDHLARRAPQKLPIELTHRTVYILPTGFGMFFALMVFVCVLGALNYNNNLALMFAFLFAVVGAQSMLLSFRNLLRLRLASIQAGPTFAGRNIEIAYSFESPNELPRASLRARLDGQERRFELTQSYRTVLALDHATSHRGWLRPSALTVGTSWPFGLFYAWTHMRPDQDVLVWPRLEQDPPALPFSPSKKSRRESDSGDDELRGLRPYVPGDAMRRIAWKRSAGREDFMTRVFEAPAEPDLVLRFGELKHLDPETAISRLAAWVELAHPRNLVFSMHLGAQQFGPDAGEAHRRRCLNALAVFQNPQSPRP